MSYKWFGAILIIVGSAGAGFSMAANDRKEESLLRQMLCAIGYMKSELQYRLTPLPQLCRLTAKQTSGTLRRLFENLALELEQQIMPEASDCMRAAIALVPDLPGSLRSICRELGASLGQLDLNGQLQGLDNARELCLRKGKHMEHNREQRLRSYQTLGICAGAALAILLI